MFYLHLPGVLPVARCRELVAEAGARGFEPAKVNYYGAQQSLTKVRNNERVEWDNPELARQLEGLLHEAAETNFPYRLHGRAYAGTGSHFRMYRYRPGQYFKPHRDGRVVLKDLESLVTVLFYLNDSEGGETILMPTNYARRDDWITVQPRTGDVLLFQHDLWHEGRPVTGGEKYVLRTDLFYRPPGN